MITAAVRVEHGSEALAATLSALVPAVAEGLVGDAVVLARAPDPGVDRVADALGATLVVAREVSWSDAARAARRDWVLCLIDGDVPAEGWMRAVERFVAFCPPTTVRARLARPMPWRERVTCFFGSRDVRAGDLVRREFLLRGGKAARPTRIAAAIARDPMVR